MPARPWPIKAPTGTPIKFGADELARHLSDLVSEGALSVTDFTVAQSGAGTAWISMGPGEGYIRQDAPEGGAKRIRLAAALDSGTGFGAPNAAGAVVWARTFATPHATLPRADRVVATLRDANYVGGTDYDWVFDVVPGTATSGATLATAAAGTHGVAAVPANSILLANVLVRAAATNILTADIDNAVKAVSLIAAGRLGKNDAGQQVSQGVNVAGITLGASPTTILTLPAFTAPAGAGYWIEFNGGRILSPGPGSTTVTFSLYRNGVAVQTDVWIPAGEQFGWSRVYGEGPPAGSITYSIAGSWTGGGATTFYANIWGRVTRYA